LRKPSTFGIASIDDSASPFAVPPILFTLPEIGCRVAPCHAGRISGRPAACPACAYFKFSKVYSKCARFNRDITISAISDDRHTPSSCPEIVNTGPCVFSTWIASAPTPIRGIAYGSGRPPHVHAYGRLVFPQHAA
jgi:hypothetical protein